MDILTSLLIIPLITVIILLFTQELKKIRVIAAIGMGIQLLQTIHLVLTYISERASGNNKEMILQKSYQWFESINIEYNVGVDGIFGPTETLIICDQSSNIDFVVSDLMAQAEHDVLGGRISQRLAPQNRPPSGGRRTEGERRRTAQQRANKENDKTKQGKILETCVRKPLK